MMVDIDPLSPPDLSDGVANCLDTYVLQNQTQDQLYEAIRTVMQEFHAKSQAYRIARQRQVPPKDSAEFAKFMAQMLNRHNEQNRDEG